MYYLWRRVIAEKTVQKGLYRFKTGDIYFKDQEGLVKPPLQKKNKSLIDNNLQCMTFKLARTLNIQKYIIYKKVVKLASINHFGVWIVEKI